MEAIKDGVGVFGFFKCVTMQQTHGQGIRYVSLHIAEEFHLFHTKSGNKILKPQLLKCEIQLNAQKYWAKMILVCPRNTQKGFLFAEQICRATDVNSIPHQVQEGLISH